MSGALPGEGEAGEDGSVVLAVSAAGATGGRGAGNQRPRSRARRAAGDEGTVMLLLLGFAVVLVGLVVVVVDVSVVLLHQRGVAAAADGAAVAAAQRLDEDVFYAQGVGARVPLDPQEVAIAVAAYAADVEPRTRLRGSTTQDGLTVVVVGEREVALPFGRFVGSRTVTVRSVARATSPVLG